ncbi:rRNA maturation RNase YbeY [Pleurocapsales cyanobacterium LEGE 10410]|nr:rRNA maturation RNase YbeY [Pleurocapsales cyanobacterium LEGE 10410]
MNITVEQSINAIVYLENLYQGSLSEDALNMVESIPWIDWFEDWLHSLSLTTDLAEDCELGLRLTGDRQIQELNYQYRSINQPTDVLAFAATEAEISIPSELAEPLYLGDLVISLDTAVKQAQEQNHSLTIELAWLASHGLLHLLGWDHPDDLSLERMLNKQSELIQLLDIQ